MIYPLSKKIVAFGRSIVALLFPVLLLFPFFAHAGTLAATDRTATSVHILATALLSNTNYKIKVQGASVNVEVGVYTDGAGAANAIFTDLFPNRSYSSSIKKYNPVTHARTDAGTSPITFYTLPAALTFSDLHATEVTLHAIGLIPGGTHRFSVVGGGAAAVNADITADSIGAGDATFLDLLPGTVYTGSISRYDTAHGVATSAGAPLVHFTTAYPVIAIGNLTSTAVTFTFTELVPVATYKVKVSGNAAPLETQFTGGTDGTSSASLSGLIAGQHYNATLTFFNDAGDEITINTSPFYFDTPADGTAVGGQTTTTGGTTTPQEPYDPNSLIPCDGTATHPCGFSEMMQLIYNVMKLFLEYLVLPIAVVVFTYGGFLYLTSGDNAGKRTDANRMFRYLIIGLVITLSAWIIVKTILISVGYDDNSVDGFPTIIQE